jgi:hypothetical protein
MCVRAAELRGAAPCREHVPLELPAKSSRGDSPPNLSDADLLVRFSRTARSLDKHCGQGFFLGELDPQRLGTRLFWRVHKMGLSRFVFETLDVYSN